MNYKILIPCLLVGLLSITGIYFIIYNNEDTTDPFPETIIKQEVEHTENEVPERRITVDVDKKVAGGCESGIIKCDSVNGCKEQC